MNRLMRVTSSLKGGLQLLATWCFTLVLCSAAVQAQSTFSSERLVDAARAHLQQRAGTSDIELKGSVADQVFGQTGVQARIRDNSLSAGSTQNVVVEFVYNDKVIRQLSIPFRIARTIEVPVAASSLPAGTILTHGHITVEERPLSAVRTRNLLPADSIIGKKLTINVSASEPLTEEKLTQADGIRRGQTVTVIARSGPIVITAQARALGDALPGEQLTVLRSGSNASIRATALGDGLVEVMP